jgi:FKBP-type peptidyl-prolyl cis-trans isomerase 2
MMKFVARMALLASVAIASPLLAAGPSIEQGSTVELEYTLTLRPSGEVVQSNVGAAPIAYVHGQGMLLPALEAELDGRQADERFELSLDAVDAYGPVNSELFREFPLEQLPEEAREVGVLLSSPEYPGSIRVSEVREDVAILDFNHPLAGQDLDFKVRVISVAAAAVPAEPSE